MNSYDEIMGGIPDLHKSDNVIIGGFLTGGVARHKIRSDMIDWRILNKIIDAQPIEDEKKLIHTANEILNLTSYIENPKILTTLIKELFNLPDKELIDVLTKSLNLTAPLINSLRELYYTWADLIEYLLNILFEKYNIDLEHNEIIAVISSVKIQSNNPALCKFLNAVKNYKHMGFCPYEPITRIEALFKFPLNDLIAAIKAEDPTAFLGLDIKELYKELQDTIFEMSKAPTIEKINRKKFKVAGLKDAINQFMELYVSAFDALENREQYYINAAKTINKTSKTIQKIFKFL